MPAWFLVAFYQPSAPSSTQTQDTGQAESYSQPVEEPYVLALFSSLCVNYKLIFVQHSAQLTFSFGLTIKNLQNPSSTSTSF